jgi:hypothetical protein
VETGGRKRTLGDHLVTWALALFLGLMGAPAVFAVVVEPFQPRPDATSNDGFTGLALLFGLGLTYGALATLRDEYGIPRAWRPSLTQGFVIAWYVGWTALIVLGMVRELIDGGLGLFAKWLGGDIAAWFVLVGLPWILATLHERRRRGTAGWVDSS